MMINQILSEIKMISDIAGYLWSKSWAEATSGNISLRYSPDFLPVTEKLLVVGEDELKESYPYLKNFLILITSAGSRMREIRRSPKRNLCIVQVGDNGKHLKIFSVKKVEEKLRPSTELSAHLAAHQMLVEDNKPQRALLHAHPPNLLALTHVPEFCEEHRLNQILWSTQPETAIFIPEGVALLPYSQTGTAALAYATAEAFQTKRVIIWEKHGCLSAGKSLDEAYDLMEILEKSAMIFLTCKNAGFSPQGIPFQEIEKLRSMRFS